VPDTATHTAPPPYQLLRVREAAEVLGVSEAKIWELLRRDEIPSLKIDGSRRITAGAIADYVASREAAAGKTGRRAGAA
jgi:excisionase family DNA binding protein